MPSNSFRDTKLFSLLAEKTQHKEEMENFCDLWLEPAELILHDQSPATRRFTLHNQEHSFRVAERMHELMSEKNREQVSENEALLLLLSAYLHDIGMCPPDSRIDEVESLLQDSNPVEIKPELKEVFDNWIYDHEPSYPFKISGNRMLRERTRELVAHFCREHHNDWSEEYIRKFLRENPDAELFNGFTEILILVCKSHHYGLSKLLGDEFCNDSSISIRFLASLLRLADISEFDPERTPQILLQRRNIPVESLLYWHRDHDIQLLWKTDGNLRQFHLSAKPKNALIHKSLEDFFESVSKEFSNCYQLSRQKDFSHEWDISPIAILNIEEGGNYKFINGSFQPDTKRILDILAGTELYKERIVALRELLQNAMDSVKEAIALSLVSEQAPLSHKISLSIEENDGEKWLICKDDGAGISKEILETQLLKSGSNESSHIRKLREECRRRGLKLQRTAKWGIGVLSYFMIADKVVFISKRRELVNELKHSGFHFETEGIGHFGELKELDFTDYGCTVKLRLRDGFLSSFEDLDALYKEILHYLGSKVKFSPCSITVGFKGEICEIANKNQYLDRINN